MLQMQKTHHGGEQDAKQGRQNPFERSAAEKASLCVRLQVEVGAAPVNQQFYNPNLYLVSHPCGPYRISCALSVLRIPGLVKV
jgi:hypothetical protein